MTTCQIFIMTTTTQFDNNKYILYTSYTMSLSFYLECVCDAKLGSNIWYITIPMSRELQFVIDFQYQISGYFDVRKLKARGRFQEI